MKKYILTIAIISIGGLVIAQTKPRSPMDKVVYTNPFEAMCGMDIHSLTPKAYRLEIPTITSKQKGALSSGYLQKFDSLEFYTIDEFTGKLNKFITNTFEFNENNQFIKYELKVFNEEFKKRVLDNKTEYFYDTVDNLYEDITYWKDSISKKWFPVHKATRIGGIHGVTEITEYSINKLTGNWQPAIKTIRSYDSHGQFITIINQMWNHSSQDWTPIRKRDWFYNVNNKPIQHKNYVWVPFNSSWELDWVFEYKYNHEGLLSEQRRVKVTGMTWLSEWKEEFEYNQYGDIEIQKHFEWNDQILDFKPIWQDDYEYNRDQSVKTVYKSNYNSTSQTWLYESKVAFTYDHLISGEELLLPFLYFNDPGDEELFFRYKVKEMQEFEWDPLTSDWDLRGVNQLHYSPLTTNVTDRNNSTIKVYPNPCNDHFNVMLNREITTKAELYLYDITGKIVLRQSLNTFNSINIKNLPAGVYNCIVKVANKEVRYRIVNQ